MRAHHSCEGLKTGGASAASVSRKASSPMRSQASAATLRGSTPRAHSSKRSASPPSSTCTSVAAVRLAGSSATVRTSASGLRRKSCTLPTAPRPAIARPER
jgi:hypothetical protein